jgi:ABC-type Mn2+/Zn2+ transport system permease subunit/Mn-dependent DtxR family transcriptional regulator
MELWQILQESWAMRALIASTMVGVTCGILGAFIVLRNMSLIGDALSHSILPGVVIAFVILGYNTFGFFIGSVIAGLLSAVAITWIQQNIRTKNDAVIGIVFTAMFSIGVIGISSISRTGVHLDLKDFLFGNVLGVGNEDLYMTGGVMVLVVFSVIFFYRYLFASTFQATIAATMGIPVQRMHYFLMLLLSFAVVAAMQTVGVILVVAMLITPASTALLLRDRLPGVLLIAGIIGFISSLSGLIFSILYEMPPGPTIAVTATFYYLVAAFFSPKKGLIAKWWRRKQQEQRIMLEDILKAGYKISFSKPLDLHTLSDALKQPAFRIKRLIRLLLQQQLLHRSGKGQYQFTDAGRDQANKIIRAHRLWESYLVHEMGMDAAQIHEEAERYEHLLTAEQVDAVDKQLGYPAKDPHGSPIPSSKNAPILAMHTLRPDDHAVISRRQPGADITYRLWQLGIGPGDEFQVKSHDHGFVIQMKENQIRVPEDLATKVSVEKASPSLL